MILGTLFYMIEEMNLEESYEIISVDINEQEQKGEAVIVNTRDNTKYKWHWDKELDIWVVEGRIIYLLNAERLIRM